MTRRTIPPGSALLAFEAAARNNSFTLAAEELFVTQGAVSRQIRSLEEFTGKKLFKRFTRRVQLTSVGKEYYIEIQRALHDIENATTTIMNSSDRAVLTVSALPTLSVSWMMPRLVRFVEQNPEIDIRLLTSIDPVNLQSSNIDVAIRVGCPPGITFDSTHPKIELDMVTSWKGVRAEYLLPDALVPVIAQSLLDQGPQITNPIDLLQYPLIHTASRKHAWDDWLLTHGISIHQKARDLNFGHFFMALRAAADNRGIAIVPSIMLVDRSISHGLLTPLPPTIRSAGNYYLLTYNRISPDSPAGRFRDWIRKEASQSSIYDPDEIPTSNIA